MKIGTLKLGAKQPKAKASPKKKLPKSPAAEKLDQPPKKHAGGRPTKYKPEYCKQMIAFFDRLPYEVIEVREEGTDEKGKPTGKIELVTHVNDLPFFFEFARKIEVCMDTLEEWKKVHQEFSVAYRECQRLQERMVSTNALKGYYKGSFAWRMGKNMFKWRDRIEVEVDQSADLKALKREEYKKLGEQELIDRMSQIFSR